MCNLVTMKASVDEVASHFKARRPKPTNTTPDDVYPGGQGFVVRQEGGERVIQAMTWGFPVRLKSMKPTSSLTWDEILPHAIKKKAAKISKGKRRFAVIPRVPELDAHLDQLRSRMRKAGVDNVLVNSRGAAWSGDGFGTSFNRVRDHAGIVHVDLDTGKTSAKHIHDLRGTFCTKLLRAGLTNEEVAEIMGWAPDQVAGIRRSYVDQSAIVRAIGERIRAPL